MEMIDILYAVLIVFISVIGTLSAIVLIKMIKIMSAVEEIVDVYEKIKTVIGYYESIPSAALEKIKSFIFRK